MNEALEVGVIRRRGRGDNVKHVGIDEVSRRKVNLRPSSIRFEKVAKRGLGVVAADFIEDFDGPVRVAVHLKVQPFSRDLPVLAVGTLSGR